MDKTVNPWMWCTPLRVVDVYGYRYYISREHYDNPKSILIPICTREGLKRTYTQAGRDDMNMLHRGNIAKIVTKGA